MLVRVAVHVRVGFLTRKRIFTTLHSSYCLGLGRPLDKLRFLLEISVDEVAGQRESREEFAEGFGKEI